MNGLKELGKVVKEAKILTSEMEDMRRDMWGEIEEGRNALQAAERARPNYAQTLHYPDLTALKVKYGLAQADMAEAEPQAL